MTPQDKAKELYDKYLPFVQRWDDFKAVSIKKENAKQCALMTADQIKEEIRELCGEEVLSIHMIYWSKVKQEIEKL